MNKVTLREGQIVIINGQTAQILDIKGDPKKRVILTVADVTVWGVHFVYGKDQQFSGPPEEIPRAESDPRDFNPP